MNIEQVYKQFPRKEDCIIHLEKVRWNNKPTCPYCKSLRITFAGKRYHCNACNTSFGVTTGTIFHKTKVDLQKWFLAISLVLNSKKGIGTRKLARDIEVNKNTAGYMVIRIKKAMMEYNTLLKDIIKTNRIYLDGGDKNKQPSSERSTNLIVN